MRTFNLHNQKPFKQMNTTLEKTTLRPLREIVSNPSGWDSLSNYLGDIPEPELLCVVTRNRDANCLTESNFACALRELGGEGENVEVHRFGHWACGWWEALAVRAGTPEADKAEGIAKRLADYPVLDEEDWSQREDEAAQGIWRDCYDTKERASYIRKNRDQFEFHSFSELRAVVRGDYFNGYASELIH
jgi:hypothetical protein